jgi:dTDP-4-amino-4,6-dideoxygalactose transaminase
MAAFSFYPGKNLGALGDAGALVCRDPAVADRVRAIREHGQLRKYEHEFVGYTARLDALQAQVLLTKLPYLDAWNDQRRSIAVSYSAGLDDLSEILLPVAAENSLPVWHLYVIRTDDPLALAAHLETCGISTGRHYPEPLHLAPAFRSLGYAPGDFPVTERLAKSVLSLPMFPGMTDAEVDAVISAVRGFFGL